MSYSLENKERGFSLVELLIALAISGIILSVISTTFIIYRKLYDVQEQITEMVQTARAAMDMMSREIRMAGYDPRNVGIVGITYDTSQLRIQADLNGDGDTDDSEDDNEDITYRYYNTTDYPFQIKRKIGSGYFQPFAENIQAFSFEYLDSNGSATAINANIRQIRITIKARTAESDPDYSDNGGYRTYPLISLITPKNLAF